MDGRSGRGDPVGGPSGGGSLGGWAQSVSSVGLWLHPDTGTAGSGSAPRVHPDGALHPQGRPPLPSLVGQNTGGGDCQFLEVGVVPHLTYGAVIGRDLPRFSQVMGDAMAVLAAVGEAQATPVRDLGVGMGAADDIRTQQREDPSLQSALEQAANPKPGQSLRFILRGGVLYREGVDPHTGQPVDQLVVPQGLRAQALRIAHRVPTARQLAADNTWQRLVSRFYWPGIQEQVRRYCASCPECQLTQPRGAPGGRMVPLPIIQIPFERVGIYIVGPLPRAVGGFTHILVLVDYAT